MRLLYPAIFAEKQAEGLKWGALPENTRFFRHVLNIRNSFPSLILASSAAKGCLETATVIAQGLLECGINVFQPAYSSPVCALTQGLAERNMPLGLYLDKKNNSDKYALYAISRHGGLFDEKDILEGDTPLKIGKTGVLGTTELNLYYLKNLAGFADRHIEPGIAFSELEIPFIGLKELAQKTSGLEILCQKDDSGPSAVISADGQRLTIIDKARGQLKPKEIAGTIAKYLVSERSAYGTIISNSSEACDFDTGCETMGINDMGEFNSLNLAYEAAFTDMLLLWAPDGVIAHRGSSCFGDALLTAVYYLEALRCNGLKTNNNEAANIKI